ncbi:hypothetical protein [Bacillus altitudinis]|uniref:hypothetical protein n=1 Tax=Bacillus altitudinis TaxID=293387 RepID=UPI0024ADA28C|nr:hypothetical protein [Bacillus altitudinis]
MINYTITFELVTGKEVTLNIIVGSNTDLYDVLNTQWVGTTDEKVNMNHVTHYIVN